MARFNIPADGPHPGASHPYRGRCVPRAGAGAAVVLTLLLGVSAPAAQGAPDDEEPAAAIPEQVEDASAAEQDPTPADDRNAEASAEVFLPSEEISEDYAVAFPVDI